MVSASFARNLAPFTISGAIVPKDCTYPPEYQLRVQLLVHAVNVGHNYFITNEREASLPPSPCRGKKQDELSNIVRICFY